jgi:hypothetical protein
MAGRQQVDEHEKRLRRHAKALWEEAGKPEGGADRFLDRARELAAIEENYKATLKPVRETGPYGEPIEENIAMENIGEFPTLVDQGEEQTYPDDDPTDVAQTGRVLPKADSGGDKPRSGR